MRIETKYRFAALAAATALVLAACGGTGDATSPTLPSLTDTTTAGEQTTTTVSVDPEEAMLEYTACMRENGVDMPDPSSGEGGVFSIGGDDLDFEAFEEASAACDPLLEAAFGDFELSPEQEAEFRDQELAFAKCMRDEGIDWPDPSPDGNPVIDLGSDDDPETLNEAMQACSKDIFGDSGGFIVGDSGSAGDTP